MEHCCDCVITLNQIFGESHRENVSVGSGSTVHVLDTKKHLLRSRRLICSAWTAIDELTKTESTPQTVDFIKLRRTAIRCPDYSPACSICMHDGLLHILQDSMLSQLPDCAVAGLQKLAEALRQHNQTNKDREGNEQKNHAQRHRETLEKRVRVWRERSRRSIRQR